ncbi:hypothetical protein BS333_17295 [Vibrio azureus]|nr:hypothetical protein BS333_17295 [Vibrio azureus]
MLGLKTMLSESQNIETYKMLGQVAMCAGGSEFKISWAMSLLEQGLETENLAILATLLKPVNEFEADDYFNRVLAELSITRPSDEAAIEGYVKVITDEVTKGYLLPESAVSKICAANVRLDYPGFLGEFTTLEDEWYCECINGWSKQKRNEEIIKACKEAYEALNYPYIREA